MKRNRRKDVISFNKVEKTRELLKLKKKEFAELMGISATHYRNCERKGMFVAYRYYAAIDAIENTALRKAIKNIASINQIKSTLNIED